MLPSGVGAAAMYTTAQQQLACLMELRYSQQPFLRRPETATSPLYYSSLQQQQQQQEHTQRSKAFTIDAILGLQAAVDSSRNQLQNKHHKSALVASLAAACRRSAAVQQQLHQQLQHGAQNHEAKLTEGKPHKAPSSGSSSGGSKSKRVRTIFTPEQLERLEAEFERQQYMVGPERLYLASALHLTEAQVKVWFQNRRIKWRKQHLEIQQQRLAAIKQQQQQCGGGPLGGPLGPGDEDSMSGVSSSSETPD